VPAVPFESSSELQPPQAKAATIAVTAEKTSTRFFMKASIDRKAVVPGYDPLHPGSDPLADR